jgi:hypothetical protein
MSIILRNLTTTIRLHATQSKRQNIKQLKQIANKVTTLQTKSNSLTFHSGLAIADKCTLQNKNITMWSLATSFKQIFHTVHFNSKGVSTMYAIMNRKKIPGKSENVLRFI